VGTVAIASRLILNDSTSTRPKIEILIPGEIGRDSNASAVAVQHAPAELGALPGLLRHNSYRRRSRGAQCR
jgi:hypothetical protein